MRLPEHEQDKADHRMFEFHAANPEATVEEWTRWWKIEFSRQDTILKRLQGKRR